MGEQGINKHPPKVLIVLIAGFILSCNHSDRYARHNVVEGGASASSSVSGTITGASSQSALTTRLRQMFRDNPALASLASKIEIGEQAGTVTVTGIVRHEQEKELVGSLIKTMPGVVAVDNQLHVSELAASANNSSAPFAHIYSNSPAITEDNILSPTSDRPGAPARIYS